MSQDLSFIKQELSNCEEFSNPFDIEKKSHVKYITLKNRQEYFYTGGKYVGMSDNKIILQNKALAKSLNLRGTPASVVNDTIIPGYVKLSNLRKMIAQ